MKRKFYFLFIIAIFTLFFHSCNFSSEEFIFDENAYNIAFSNWKKLNIKDYLFDFYYEGDINKIIFHVKVENGLGSITGTSIFVEYEEDEVKKVLLQEQIDEIVSKNSIKSMTELFISQYEQMKKTKSEYNTSSKKYVSGSFEIIYDTEFHYIKKAESILISNKKDEADGIYNYSIVIKNFEILK